MNPAEIDRLRKENERLKAEVVRLQKLSADLAKARADFVAATSHNLHTPLAVAKESIAQVLEGFGGEISGEQTRILTMAAKNIDRLIEVVGKLLK